MDHHPTATILTHINHMVRLTHIHRMALRHPIKHITMMERMI
jgi:hypothetical protein